MAIIRVTQSDEVIAIGKTGENAATTVFFNISAWMQEYGTGGTAVLLHQRKGDESPYPCDTELENGVVKWEVTSADVAAAGRGLCELQYVVDDTVVKSRIWTTETAASMDDAGEAPDPEDGWIASLLAEIAELTEAVPVVTITQTSSGAKVTATDASGTTTATIYNGTDGADGEDGEDGNGIASLVQTTSSTASGGANVWTATMDDGTTSSLTVYNGAQGETGADGADGATGADGAAGADGNGIASLVQTTSSTESGGENVWTCTMDDGTTSTLTVCNGAQGEQGETGKGLTILGYYDTLAALTAAVTGPEDGDVYAVGTEAPYEIYVYTSANGWVDNGQLQGAAGADGEDGEDGVGIASLTQTTSSTASGGANVWTATLTDGTTSTLTVYNGAAGAAGEDGEDGAAATITIGTVTTGAAGSSASVTNSGTTTAAVFNFTIPQGAQGDTGADGEDGEDGADGADGADGKSAYEYAVDGGYTGAETEFATLLATIVTLIDAEEASY